MKVIRWKYVAPRLMLVAIVVAAIRFGLDPAIKWLIVTGGESAVGAKVEMANVATSLGSGTLEITDLQVANPQETLQNLLQAKQIRLQLDTNALLHKRLLVRTGEITGIELNTTRATSGALEDQPLAEQKESLLTPVTAKLEEVGTNWLLQASDRWEADFVGQLKTPPTVDAIEEKWKVQAAALQGRVEQLKRRGKQLEDEFRDIKKNPLRGVQRLPELQAELNDVQQQLKSLQQDLQGIPQQAKSDRQAIMLAKQHDEEFLRKQLQFDKLDGDNLTQVLLGKPVAENLQSACEWIAWIRQRLPSSAAKKVNSQRSRGTNVHFAPRGPRLEVRHLALELTANVGGKPMLFVGQLSGVSSEPQLLTEPARLTLAAAGEVPVDLDFVSDHRSSIAKEELSLRCPALPVSERMMGDPQKFALQVPAGTARVDVHVCLEGDQLAGRIRLDQQAFQLSLCTTSAKSKPLTDALSQALADIRGVNAEVQLSGTLKRPEFHIESALGDQLSTGIGMAMTTLAQERSAALLAKLSRQVDARVAQLSAARDKLQQELLTQLGRHQQYISELAALGRSPGASRLSVPELGSRLGSGLLRK